MKDQLIQRVLNRDPREKRKKTPGEIRKQWLERRAYGLLFTIPGFLGLAYFCYWFGTRVSSGEGIPVRAALPVDASWALGLTVFGFLGWGLWGSWGYSCPNCQRFVGLDWSFGFGVFDRPDGSQQDCPHCSVRLS